MVFDKNVVQRPFFVRGPKWSSQKIPEKGENSSNISIIWTNTHIDNTTPYDERPR